MNREIIDDICITICILAVLAVIAAWLYWTLVTQRQLDVEIIKAMGGDAYQRMRACLQTAALCAQLGAR